MVVYRVAMIFAVAGWLASGAVAYFVGPSEGVMCVVTPAVVAAVAQVRRGQVSARRAFIHGWHAGFHEARHTDCIPADEQPCDVYLLSERRWMTG